MQSLPKDEMTVKQLRTIAGISQAELMKLCSFPHTQQEFSRKYDRKTLKQLKKPIQSDLLVINSIERQIEAKLKAKENG